jgi:hypothetical protein
MYGKNGGNYMTGRITKANWDLVFEGIMDVVDRNLADPDALKAELEEYLTGEGIIEVIRAVV